MYLGILCVCALLWVCVLTLRARYRVMSISWLLRPRSCFYYQHHNGGVYVLFNISPPAHPPLILRLRFMALHYICLVTLIHPSHTDTCTHTLTHSPAPTHCHSPTIKACIRAETHVWCVMAYSKSSSSYFPSFSWWLQVPWQQGGWVQNWEEQLNEALHTFFCSLNLLCDWQDGKNVCVCVCRYKTGHQIQLQTWGIDDALGNVSHTFRNTSSL